MTHYERIKKCVSAAPVDANDIKIMIDTFAEVDDASLEGIANLFEKDPKWVTLFNDNRKAKQTAMGAGDPALLQDIFEQEKKYIHDLTYALD